MIIGPRNVEQLEGNLEALDLRIDEQAMERLEEVSEPVENYLDFMQGNHFMRRMADLED